jgi:predicted aldo/keto reductase-like oxidoreductase
VDILFAYAHYRDNFGAALAGIRDDLLVAGHLGAAETDGQYRRSREVAECEALFHDLLQRLRTDYVDALFLSNCDEADDYERVMADDGLLGLAQRLQQEGLARFIAFSGHAAATSLRAAESGAVDVVMHNINMADDSDREKHDVYRACAAAGVGLVAMKPFAGGRLLAGDGPAVTPVQCLSYALAQPGVATVVPGVKDVPELEAALGWASASADQRDFSAVLPQLQDATEGLCVYCNHCLPCPAGIDVGATLRLLDTALRHGADVQRRAYAQLPAPASDCTQCGACVERCPFGVDAPELMEQAARLFEA